MSTGVFGLGLIPVPFSVRALMEYEENQAKYAALEDMSYVETEPVIEVAEALEGTL